MRQRQRYNCDHKLDYRFDHWLDNQPDDNVILRHRRLHHNKRGGHNNTNFRCLNNDDNTRHNDDETRHDDNGGTNQH